MTSDEELRATWQRRLQAPPQHARVVPEAPETAAPALDALWGPPAPTTATNALGGCTPVLLPTRLAGVMSAPMYRVRIVCLLCGQTRHALRWRWQTDEMPALTEPCDTCRDLGEAWQQRQAVVIEARPTYRQVAPAKEPMHPLEV